MSNPGTALASAVDAEVAKYRIIQQELQQLRSDLQTIMGQQTENEMVLEELKLMSPSSSPPETPPVVYKMVGPVLLKQPISEASKTVKERLDFIGKERKKIQDKMESKEKQANEAAALVQQLQSQLQQATAEAVRAVAAQHGIKS
jgi:prefoldin beta subunit